MLTRSSLLAIVLLVMVTAACADGTSGGPVDGRVIDEATGKGIADAFVIVRWTGILGATNLGGSPADVCYHVEVVKTGADGGYHVPQWTSTKEDQPRYVGAMNFRSNKFLLVSAYAPGFQLGRRYSTLATDVDLMRFSGTFEEREVANGAMLSGWYQCVINSTTNKLKFLDMKKAIYREKVTMARTAQERDRASQSLLGIDELELGEAEALRRAARREEELRARKRSGQ